MAEYPSTIGEALRATAARLPDRVAVRTVDDATAWTWGELHERANALAAGLRTLGVRPGDRLGVLLSNRPEFHLVDLAALLLGAVPFSVYYTYAPEQIEFVLTDAGASVLVTEEAALDRARTAARLAGIEQLIVVDGETADGARSLDALLEAGRAEPAPTHEADPDDPITIIYTSGTTGNPKGVQITHRNVLAAARACEGRVAWPEESRVVSWLPAAHIAERVAHHYLPVIFGAGVTCCADPRQIAAYLPKVRPTWFFAVPRVWEKLKSALEASLPDEALAAVATAVEKVRLEQAGEPVPDDLARRVADADTGLFSGLRRSLGLDDAATMNVGAAPTPPEVLEFFHAIGLPVSELWGMSESTGSGCSNPPGQVRIGTVGPPAAGVELRLADDGEILIRGDVVTPGYRNQPERTAETIVDGWLHTGDIGTLDADGYLTIVDRKKELIINAMGKNMSPALIESRLKAASPLIGQACCIGDGRSYNTALIVLDPDAAAAWATRHGLDGADPHGLATDPAVVAAVDAGVSEANARLSRVEQVKKFTIVPGDWAPAGDELTPTMKLRRRSIGTKYAELIERMYAP